MLFIIIVNNNNNDNILLRWSVFREAKPRSREISVRILIPASPNGSSTQWKIVYNDRKYQFPRLEG